MSLPQGICNDCIANIYVSLSMNLNLNCMSCMTAHHSVAKIWWDKGQDPMNHDPSSIDDQDDHDPLPYMTPMFQNQL